MSVGAIQYTSIRLYTLDWPDDEADMFATVIRAMDRVYMDHASNGGKPQEFTREAFRTAFSSK